MEIRHRIEFGLIGKIMQDKKPVPLAAPHKAPQPGPLRPPIILRPPVKRN
jgi:hypothetical protein